jgi:ArsR family metal-binding transcriptional regulator
MTYKECLTSVKLKYIMKATNTTITSSAIQDKRGNIELSNGYLILAIYANGAVRRSVNGNQLAVIRPVDKDNELDEIYDSGMDIIVKWIKKKTSSSALHKLVCKVFNRGSHILWYAQTPWHSDHKVMPIEALIWD